MSSRILSDPGFALGLVVWIVAASVFPLQLGLSGASAAGFLSYVVLAGALLAVADAILHAQPRRDLSDLALQTVFWVIGIALPAAIAFGVGSMLSPARGAFDDDLCRLSGVVLPADNTEGALAEAFDPTENCEAPA